MTEEAVEVSPFDFVQHGGADKDFSPMIEQVDPHEVTEVEVPKDSVRLKLTFSPIEKTGSGTPPVLELPPPTDLNPPAPELIQSTGASTPSPPPATPPIPSSPSVAKTTPQAS